MAATTELIREIDKDRFYQGILKLMQRADGNYYALPCHGWVQGIWYRADCFEKAVLKLLTTWDATWRQHNAGG